jgi:2-keto-3-deoxy-L-rhamnonate aldolase RhmA
MDLKEKLQKKEITIGSWITLGHPSIAEIMAGVGFDWLTIDMEHSAITLDQTQSLVQIIELCGLSPLVRVGHNDPHIIKRVMDTGAHGVIVPMVNTKEEAEKAVASVKYPPAGFRGVGLARAQKYGKDFDGYRQWNERESIVIVQIEHIKAVDNLESILSVEGVDGFIVGPYDLSGSLGVPGLFEHPDVVSALERVKVVSSEMNKPAGFHVVSPNPKECIRRIEDGYTFIAYSLDTLLLYKQCFDGLSTIKNKQFNVLPK